MWLAENKARVRCECSENRISPEAVGNLDADQKERGPWGRECVGAVATVMIMFALVLKSDFMCDIATFNIT